MKEKAKKLAAKVNRQSITSVEALPGQYWCTSITGAVYIVYMLPAKQRLFCYNKNGNPEYCNY